MSVSQRYWHSDSALFFLLCVFFFDPLLWGPPLDIPISTTVNQIFSYFCPALLLQHHHQHLWTVSYSSSLSLFFSFLTYLIVLFISFYPVDLRGCVRVHLLCHSGTHTPLPSQHPQSLYFSPTASSLLINSVLLLVNCLPEHLFSLLLLSYSLSFFYSFTSIYPWDSVGIDHT